MRMLNSVSSRFSRSFNYTMPEYRHSKPKGVKTRIALTAPVGQKGRSTDNRGTSTGGHR